MLTLPTMFDKRIKAAVPSRSAWQEAWGFLLLGLGLYLALACYTFSPFDYGPGGLIVKVRNMAGPYGAYASAHILGRFGIIGMIWPVAFLAWGALTATGFVLIPRPRRLIGLIALSADLAGFAAVLLPRTTLPEPSFGFGGIVGHMIKASLLPQMGFGGTVIALSVAGIVALVLTGNLTVSSTASYVTDAYFGMRRIIRKQGKKALSKIWAKVWVEWILNQEPAAVAAPASALGPVKVARDAHGSNIVVEPKKRAPRVSQPEGEEAEPVKSKAPAADGTIELEIFYEGAAHGKPEASLFSRSKKIPDMSKHFKVISDNLVQQLAEFKINGEIKAVTQGPVVTTYEFKPAPGTKVSKISALGEDLARLLKAQSLRVIAPIPGKDTVGFEVPNLERATIGFADLIDAKEFKSQKRRLPIAMGVDIFGNTVVEDLAEMPHLLVAGSTGSGKSVFMNTLIGSLISRHSAATLRLIMIDPKMVEMAAYNALPHMACPVITDPVGQAKDVLQQLCVEMDDRYMRMRAVGARNIDSFNEVVKTKRKGEFNEFEGRWAPMPYVVLIIDELADMMMMLGKDAEMPITRLAQKARACGIHMVIATQRPSADVVTGLIKANFPTRVAFRVLSGIDSRTILDQSGAETLLGKGDMLFLASGGAHRLHGAYLSEAEVQSMVRTTRSKKK